MIILLLACGADDTVLDSGTCSTETWYYYDADGDGYGNVDEPVLACSAPPGYRDAYGDCDDLDPSTHPAATETCNGRDDDCNTRVDDDADDASTWYPDSDGDGFGVSTGSTVDCQQPAGFVDNDDDTDDDDAAAHPGATEQCDGADNDGDGEIDESGSEGERTFFYDGDGDGHGDPLLTLVACDAPDDYVAEGDDCDDADPTSYPGAAEEDCADPVDRNCDGSVGYADADLDGHPACTDCDDADASQHPGADEVCNGEDDDCDGDNDEDATDASTWYLDADGDGRGGPLGTTDCAQPGGYAPTNDDCDDGEATVYPGASETCNGVDDDCDGDVDDDTVDGTTRYDDADGDGYGDPATGSAECEDSGRSDDGSDCDDTDPWRFPGAPEQCNGADDDCDGDTDESGAEGESTFYADHDNDGYGELASTTQACSAPAGYVADATDCDDYDGATSPGASETCDGEDDDCDGTIDEDDAIDAPTWYLDVDGDGYGGTSGTTAACDAVPGYAATGDDCDDNDEFAYPGAPELCDGKATDCSDASWTTDAGLASFYVDADDDWVDYSSLLATGTATSPVTIAVEDDGQLNVCAGTWYVSIVADAYLDFTLSGPEGRGVTFLDGAGLARVLQTAGGGDVLIEGVTVQNGYAAYGGGLYGGSYYSQLRVSDTTFTGNEAYADGGAAFLANQSETFTFTDVTFDANTAGAKGGAVAIGTLGGGYSTLNLDSVTLTGNTAPYGAGVYLQYDVDAVATDLEASGNDATLQGGVFAVTISSTLSLESSALHDNEAANGAAVWVSSSSATVEDSEIHDNTAYGSGGAFYLYSASSGQYLTLANSAVFDNVAYGSGGGLFHASGTTYCAGTTASDEQGFYGNEAVGGDGADVYLSSSTTMYAVDCDFLDSTDSTSGEIYNSDGNTYTFGNDETFTCDSGGCL